MGNNKLLVLLVVLVGISATILPPSNPYKSYSILDGTVNLGSGPIDSSYDSKAELNYVSRAMRRIYPVELQGCQLQGTAARGSGRTVYQVVFSNRNRGYKGTVERSEGTPNYYLTSFKPVQPSNQIKVEFVGGSSGFGLPTSQKTAPGSGNLFPQAQPSLAGFPSAPFQVSFPTSGSGLSVIPTSPQSATGSPVNFPAAASLTASPAQAAQQAPVAPIAPAAASPLVVKVPAAENPNNDIPYLIVTNTPGQEVVSGAGTTGQAAGQAQEPVALPAQAVPAAPIGTSSVGQVQPTDFTSNYIPRVEKDPSNWNQPSVTVLPTSSIPQAQAAQNVPAAFPAATPTSGQGQ